MEVNNFSTIATWTAVLVIILQLICKYFHLEIGESDLTILANAIIALIIAVWSSRNPNTLAILGNAPINGNINYSDCFDNDAPVESDDNDGC